MVGNALKGSVLLLLISRENRISHKIPVLEKKGKKSKIRMGSLANRVQNERFTTYLEFGSSDFDETFRKCSWYEKNEY